MSSHAQGGKPSRTINHGAECPDFDLPKAPTVRKTYTPTPTPPPTATKTVSVLVSPPVDTPHKTIVVSVTAGTTAEIEPLTNAEQTELLECEAVVRADIGAAFRVGAALRRIRDGRLYRCTGLTFREYAREKFGIGEAYAFRLIEAYAVKNSPIGELITNEAQARAIAKVPVADRAAVIDAVFVSGNAVTADAIKNAAKRIVKPKEPVEVHSVGKPIPKGMLESWHRCVEIAKEGHRTISAMKSTLRTADEAQDPAYNEVNLSSMMATLSGIYFCFSKVKPYAVCHTCQGLRSSKCAACRGRGFVSKDFYENCVPVEFKVST